MLKVLFFSRTTWPISIKLCMKHSEVKLVQMVAKILYAKGELFKLHDEFLVVNLIFFSK